MNEFEWIASFAGRQRYSSRVLRGIGDDCAVLRSSRPGYCLVVSTDLMTEGVHFQMHWGSPEWLGEKSVMINLSDIAAMGATPTALLSSVCIPKGDLTLANQIMRGIERQCEIHGVDLIGGDTNRGRTDWTISNTIMGEVRENEILYRSGARVGDLIFCTGTIGDSGLGLACLQNPDFATRLDRQEQERVMNRFLRPIPKVALGRRLSETGKIHAMIDISDGLVQDLCHLLRASGVYARLDPQAIPLSLAFRQSGETVLQACRSGEDYELLFTAPKDCEREILQMADPETPITCIGEIMEKGSSLVDGVGGFSWEGAQKGFDHFAE